MNRKRNYEESMTTILYVHGFGSRYDQTNEKVLALSELGEVHGIDIDYSVPHDVIVSILKETIQDNEIDLIVGTSFGGFWAAEIGSSLGIPFVAINPVIHPVIQMSNRIGSGTTYYGEPYTITQATADSYPETIATNGAGLVLLDEADDVLPAAPTMDMLDSCYEVIIFEGGNHRFAHIAESIEHIQRFANSADFIYSL